MQLLVDGRLTSTHHADALAVALRYKGQKAVLKSFYQKEQIRARQNFVCSWRENDALLQKVTLHCAACSKPAKMGNHNYSGTSLEQVNCTKHCLLYIG